jgi:hypothetical protein
VSIDLTERQSLQEFGMAWEVDSEEVDESIDYDTEEEELEAMEAKKERELRAKEAIWAERDNMERMGNELEELWRVQNHTDDATSDEEDESSDDDDDDDDDDDSCDKEEEERMRKRLKRKWKRKQAKKLLRKQARKMTEAEAYFDRQFCNIIKPFPGMAPEEQDDADIAFERAEENIVEAAEGDIEEAEQEQTPNTNIERGEQEMVAVRPAELLTPMVKQSNEEEDEKPNEETQLIELSAAEAGIGAMKENPKLQEKEVLVDDPPSLITSMVINLFGWIVG